MHASRSQGLGIGLLIGGHGQANSRQAQRRTLPAGTATGADKQVGSRHQLPERPAVGQYLPARPLRRQCLQLCPPGVSHARHHCHLQLGEVRQCLARLERLPRGVHAAKIDQHPLDLSTHGAGWHLKLLTQQRVARAQQQLAGASQQRPVALGTGDVILVEQQIDGMGTIGQIVDRGNARRPTLRRALPMVVEAVMVDDDPVEPRLGRQLLSQGVDVGLPGQQRLDVCRGGTLQRTGQGKHRPALRSNHGQQVTGQSPASKTYGRTLAVQHVGQRQAAHHMATADGGAGIGPYQHVHGCNSPPASSAAYRYSARVQSAAVSMSCTR